MSLPRYRLSFTTGGLFTQEAPIVTQHYLETHSWKKTRDHVRSHNVLQVRTAAAATRISKEVISRLECLSQRELEFLLECSQRDLAYLLWSAACRRYTFLEDFAVEMLRERYLTLHRTLGHHEFDLFVNGKAVHHAEVDDLATSTLKKLRSNLFRMLREADLISENGTIQSALLSPELAQLLAQSDSTELSIFPATDSDIKGWLK